MGGLLAVVLVAVVVVVVVVVFRTPVSSARYRLPASSALGHRRARCQAALVAPKLRHSVWLASHRRQEDSAATACHVPPTSGPMDTQLVAWTALVPPAAATDGRADGLRVAGGGGYGGGDAAGALPFPPVPVGSLRSMLTGRAAAPTLAALPRASVGRMCGARLSVDPAWLTRARPVPCPGLGGGEGGGLGRQLLGQDVLHMQFTHAETRKAILRALHWWRAPPSPATAASSSSSSSFSSQQTTCAALAAGSSPASAGRLSAIIVSSALATSTLLCLVPGPIEGQSLHVAGGADQPGSCPCCWKVEELQKGVGAATTAGDAASSAAEAKALSKARRYTGCRIWRRHA